ncbi:MAG TPA: 5-formyltetrahydrofolate cyclo-ligase [Casimicrobiaceae bacterium]|nr:5-formyltetrahydrofolate cyclo-ligase [Casimicrobiaceae bacterium]
MTLRDDKRTLRESVTAARDALPAVLRASASRSIADRIATLPSWRAARVVLLTLPFRSEWDARLVARDALAAGKTVTVPRVVQSSRMLRALAIEDLERDVEAGYRGIPEPRADLPAIPLDRIDWVLVPGIAFDPAGTRLGYGGGYYDRLLPLLQPPVERVAGAFEVQLVDRVPSARHDIGVDCIVTERRMLACTRMPA